MECHLEQKPNDSIEIKDGQHMVKTFSNNINTIQEEPPYKYKTRSHIKQDNTSMWTGLVTREQDIMVF